MKKSYITEAQWTHLAATNRITPQQLRVLKLLEDGKRDNEIADALDIRFRTVRSHLSRLYALFDVDSRLALVTELHRRLHQNE